MTGNEPSRNTSSNKFFRHVRLLAWKSIVQRKRRWVNLTLQNVFAGVLFLISVFMSQKVFLESVQENPNRLLSYEEITRSLAKGTILGYAPNEEPFTAIMQNVSSLLGVSFMRAETAQALNEKLYSVAMGVPLKSHVIWVIWKPKVGNVWRFSIRCTELAHMEILKNTTMTQNRHLRVGFLAVQMAVSEALLAGSSNFPTHHKIQLKAMPMSPLMEEEEVRSAIAWILIFFTVAFIPPVMEISALVVTETTSRYKRALRMRDVDYSSMYLGWLAYAFLTALPNCLLASLALITIFRWILLFFAVVFVFTYVAVTVMFALIMAMFHHSRVLASIWSALLTLLQLSLAELLVHHGVVTMSWFSFALHILLPPLGLVNGFNSFALLQTGRGGRENSEPTEVYTIFLWLFMIHFYFGVLMLLQRTIGQERAIGGQVSWRSIIFKKAEDTQKLRVIHNLTGNERDKLQEVDERFAKAVSFRHVSKSIMGVPVLTDITFDTYRCEYTMIFSERIQDKLINTVEDLIVGLSAPDKGTITVLGRNKADLPEGKTLVTMPHLMGYCHQLQVLVQEFTVQEHLQFFTELALWDKRSDALDAYFVIHSARVLKECDLEFVRHVNVGDLDSYYQAQLCWAISIILEPQMIYVTQFAEDPSYVSVINDKILKYKGEISVLKMCHWTQSLEFADRIFVFDKKKLAFGGTPAYMFFKYGREYRIRITVTYESSIDPAKVSSLLTRVEVAGANVRTHLGSMLILRVPTWPTAAVASFIKDLTENAAKYGITTLHVSLPDCDEICRRAIDASRLEADAHRTESSEVTQAALKRLAPPRQWDRINTWFVNWACFRAIAWKFMAFYVHYRLWLIVTIMAAMVTGCIIGISLSIRLGIMGDSLTAKQRHGEKMMVEAYPVHTTLVLQANRTKKAIEVATAYCLSHTNMTNQSVAHITYTALPSSESATEYLILRAIDSPQHYVYMYAYGLSVIDTNDTLHLSALYSPVHQDSAAAARSIARLYMALLRHYTGLLDADIEVTDEPLELESSETLETHLVTPLYIQFMLILTMSHVTLLPSKEYGLIRHTQAYATNSSPCRYWFYLLACDLILFWFLVFIMTSILISVMFLISTTTYFTIKDLVVIPFILIMYGLSSVPQAYLFSLGPNPHLNTVTFVVFNVVVSEAKILSEILYGTLFNFAERFLSLSPQYNVANAFIRTTQIFVHNSECILYNQMNLCATNALHKCCSKCGIMQPCFKRITYLSQLGVLVELIGLLISAFIFIGFLMLWEYKCIQRLWIIIFTRFVYRTHKVAAPVGEVDPPRELKEVVAKKLLIKTDKNKARRHLNKYGGLLLAYRVSLREGGEYIVRDVSFGIESGQALGLTGLTRHGRIHVCEVLAGYQLPSAGNVYAMSQYGLTINPHKFATKVGLCSYDNYPLPPWMTVHDALMMVAVLRGVPTKYAKAEVKDYIDALELTDKANDIVYRLPLKELTRLNFAAVVIGAPPVLVLDEYTAYQKPSVVRSMYFILHNLRKRGHGILAGSFCVESHMPLTNHLAILLDGYIYDIDQLDNLVNRSQQGYTVVVHLRTPVDVRLMFDNYFKEFIINDTTTVLANVQVFDVLDYSQMFGRMEKLQEENYQVNTYVIASISMDFVYNKILQKSKGLTPANSSIQVPGWNYITNTNRKIIRPIPEKVNALKTFEHNYDIVTLKLLPWSVIFRNDVHTW